MKTALSRAQQPDQKIPASALKVQEQASIKRFKREKEKKKQIYTHRRIIRLDFKVGAIKKGGRNLWQSA